MAEWQSAETLARGRGKPQEIKGGGDNELDVRGAGTADGFRRLADDGVPRMAENKAVKGAMQMGIRDKPRIMAQMDEVNKLRTEKFVAEQRKQQAASFIRVLGCEVVKAQRFAESLPNQYGGNHPCVITAQTLTDAYDAACETYKILTGEQP